MSFSDYLESAVLGHVFGSTTLVKPASLHIALTTSATTDGAAGTEISTDGTGYSRRPAMFTISGTTPSSARNSATVVFGPFLTAIPDQVNGFIVYDAAIGGNILVYGTFTARTYASGDMAQFNVNDLEIRLD